MWNHLSLLKYGTSGGHSYYKKMRQSANQQHQQVMQLLKANAKNYQRRLRDKELRKLIKGDNHWFVYALTMKLAPQVITRIKDLSLKHSHIFPWPEACAQRVFTAISRLWQPVFDCDPEGWAQMSTFFGSNHTIVQLYTMKDRCEHWWMLYIVRLPDKGRYYMFGRRPASEDQLLKLKSIFAVPAELLAFYQMHDGLIIFRPEKLVQLATLCADTGPDGVRGDWLVAPIHQVLAEHLVRQNDTPRRVGWCDSEYLVVSQNNGHQDTYGFKRGEFVHFDHESPEYETKDSFGDYLLRRINWNNTLNDYY